MRSIKPEYRFPNASKRFAVRRVSLWERKTMKRIIRSLIMRERGRFEGLEVPEKKTLVIAALSRSKYARCDERMGLYGAF